MIGLADILNATAEPCPIVMGFRLVPFSVGHALILHRIGSPLIAGGLVGRADLMEAVLICSQPPGDALRSMRSFARGLIFKLWVFKTRRLSLEVEIEKWNQWIGEQSTSPEILTKPGRRRALSMPWPERTLACCLEIGLSESTVLSMPIGDAERLILARAETHGDVELWSPKDDALWRWAQQHQAINN